MTIAQAIAQIDALKPNLIPQADKLRWLSDLDGMIHHELVSTHELPEDTPETFDGYDADTDATTALLVPEPYAEVYRHYLASQIDLVNAETVKYQNDKALYNNAYLTYSDYYTRTHMPLCRVLSITL